MTFATSQQRANIEVQILSTIPFEFHAELVHYLSRIHLLATVNCKRRFEFDCNIHFSDDLRVKYYSLKGFMNNFE